MKITRWKHQHQEQDFKEEEIMFNYTSFEIGLLIFLATFCIFTILNRICNCIEHCATARAVGKMKGAMMKEEDMEKMIDGWKCEDNGN